MKQKNRKSFVPDKDTAEKLARIKSRYRLAENESVIFRLGIQVLDDLITHVSEEGEIILKKKDGTSRKYSLLFKD